MGGCNSKAPSRTPEARHRYNKAYYKARAEEIKKKKREQYWEEKVKTTSIPGFNPFSAWIRGVRRNGNTG